jgi:membrane protease YdiL (CAAX protease family)
MTDNNQASHHSKDLDFTDSSAAVHAPTELRENVVAAPAAKPLWAGVLFWLALCAVYLGIGNAGLIELWFVTPFVFALVASQALEARTWMRLFIGVVAISLALLTIVVGVSMLVWRQALWLPDEPYIYPLAICLILLGCLALPCLIRRVRASIFPAIGLNQESALHATTAVMFVVVLVSCGGIFVLLLNNPGETILVHLKDPIISLLSDIPLALAGVGLMLKRDFKQSLERLGFFSISWRDLGWAAVVSVSLILAVLLFEFAEKLLLPEIHALEDRFPMKFANVSPLLGIPAVSLAAGLGEEAVFRGALQPRFGIILTALLFAALHVQYQLPGIVLIFVIGIFLGILRKRKSTTFTACVHIFYDTIAFLLPDF